jgi:activator of HSP90 ATPase
MNEKAHTPAINSVTRRQAIAAITIAFGSLAAGSRAVGDPQEAARETPGPAPGRPRMSLHYEADFKVVPRRVYEVLMEPKEFAEMTGRPAEIEATQGGAFSLFGGLIVGRNVELVPSQRIVQAWRPTHWDPGVYSIVRFEFSAQGPRTRMVLDHTGFPEAEADSLDSGWKGHYLDPLAKFLA